MLKIILSIESEFSRFYPVYVHYSVNVKQNNTNL